MRQPQPTSSRRRLPDLYATRVAGALAAAAAGALLVVAGASADPSAKTRVTVVGDSIMASFDYVPAARRSLGSGLDVRADNAVCRRLVAASCAFQGSTPSTALDIVRAQGRALGRVVVINVGYNDWAAVYDVDRMMKVLTEVGVQSVIWVTLREAGANASLYAHSNARIRDADRRWKRMVVADWNGYSRGKPWFRQDGLHLSVSGAMGLARFLRPLLKSASSPA
jgi:hypothetical protein